MGEFLYAAAGFPAILFSAALPVVLGFWLLVALGGAAVDSFDADANAGAVGLGGVPVAVVVSLMVVAGWFTSLAGSVLIGRSALTGLVHVAADVALLFLSLLIAWWVTRRAVRARATRAHRRARRPKRGGPHVAGPLFSRCVSGCRRTARGSRPCRDRSPR
ncbi:hypothetical protein ABZ837_20815 [Streptomyces sp. NPDC047197]|uniref:hypothetical protein n=1 Tax=Streptomyces sp. NPDC047197 TaxID=3155477 RepID=UPI00341127A7